MKLTLWIFAGVALCALGAGGYWYVQHGSQPLTSVVASEVVEGETPVTQPAPGLQGSATYTDQVYKFSIAYPNGYRIGKFTNDGGDTLTLQNDTGTGLQLIITPFDEDLSSLTAARIKQDIPNIDMRDVREVPLPAAGIPAVAFKSSGGGFGNSMEVWFVHGGYLYQASTYEVELPFLEQVLGTLRF